MGSQPQGHSRSMPQAPVYVWQSPGGELTVHLSLGVVRQLRAAIAQAPKAGERDAEIGGLLLGTAERGETSLAVINDFELFPSEHARGQSYTLAAIERSALQKRIRQRLGDPGRQAVGWFRTHTRPGLYLDQSDLAVMSELFPAHGDLALLVGPGAECKAGFFFWESGEIRRQAPYTTFPFDEIALASGGHRVARRFESQPAAAAATTATETGSRAAKPRVEPSEGLPVPPPSVQPALPPPPVNISWLRPRVWLAGAAIGAVMILSVMAARKAIVPGTAIHPARAPSLALRVEKAPGGLKLAWDNHSRLIENARGAVLHIADGEKQYTLELTPSQLALGSMMYFANAPDVAFEMVVSAPAGEAREVLRSFAPLQAPGEASREWAGQVPGLPPAGTPGALPSAVPDEIGAEPPPRPHAPRRAEPKAFAGLPPAVRASTQPVLTAPPSLDSAVPSAHNGAAPYIGGSYPRATVTVRSVPGSGLWGKIPLLRRLQKRPQQEPSGFVSARPVRQVAPVVPPSLDSARDVDVRVRIDEAGEVQDAEVLTKGAEDLLANAALTAARDWRFEPAQKNGREVPSELVLRFAFNASSHR